MINLAEQQNDWQKHFGQFDSLTMSELIALGRHWIQIKTLERNEISVYWNTMGDPDFESKMKGVADFLYDLRKNIWQ